MAIISAISSALVGVGLSIFGATAAGWAAATAFANIVLGAAFLGGSALLARATAPTMKTPQAQAVINQSVGPRIRGYGRALLGGTRAFFDTKDGYLYQVIMMHHGEIDAVEYFKVGDRVVSLDGNGDVTNSEFITSTSNVRIRYHLGSPDQAADSLMTSVWSQWTSAHRLRGIAYSVVRFRSTSEVAKVSRLSIHALAAGFRSKVCALL